VATIKLAMYELYINLSAMSTQNFGNVGSHKFSQNKMGYNLVNVELIDKCICSLKLDTACGPDGLCAEHLLNAYPKFVTFMCALSVEFYCIIMSQWSLVKVLLFH